MDLHSLARRGLALGIAAAVVVLGAPTAHAAAFGSPAVVYTAGGISSGGVYYAKSGSTLTLTVNTDDKARCVHVAGLAKQTSTVARTVWTFAVPAPTASDGVRSSAVTIGESSNVNTCTMRTAQTTASYVLDNTGPAAVASLAPTPNAAGWNRATVAVSWTANDGTGVGGGSVTGGTSVAADTAGQTVSGTATDALGNVGPPSSVVVKRDTAIPLISGNRVPAANGFGWNNTDVTVSFTCSDGLSLIKSCLADGTAGASKTLTGGGGNQSVGGTATDNADNTATASVGGVNIDKAAPTISASATPYVPGTWTNQDVTVSFSCADALSGVDTCSAPVVLQGEGADQSAGGTAKDKAGNTTGTTLSDVDIDRTAPTTGATAPQTAWNNTDVTVALTAADALSGVRATHYTVNGGPTQTGASLPLSAEGSYLVSYWSVDNAGNTESAKTVTVNIDKTPPSISHSLSPAANANGWHNGAVAVTFTCGDTGGSGVASCGPDRTVDTEGKDQDASGTVVDTAGNSATDPATVSIDTTKPVVTPSVSGSANEHGWHNQDVTVSFECVDALSGVDSCTTPITLGERAGQSATGTGTDAAGNTGSATVSGVNVDKTPPTLTGSPSATGWSAGDVTVTWTCTDTGSGVLAAPVPTTVGGEGADLSASTTCTDKAGNAAVATVSGIGIDRAAPNSAATVTAPFAGGWHADTAEVTLTAADALSGVAATYYRVDDGSSQLYTGPFAFTSGGKHVIDFWSVDTAGNLEDTAGNSIGVWIDNAVPTISGSRTPANAHGWNNAPVTVSFACADSQSGVAGCTDPVELTAEGADQSVGGTAVDGVDKTATTAVGGIGIDLTAPTLTPTATEGWHNSDVTVGWTAADGLSGIDPATQPADSVITGEGRDLGAGPVTVKDKAGNESAPTSVTGVTIDRTGPAITGGPITAPNAAGWYRDEVVVDFACADPTLADGTAGSGVATCPTSKVLKTDAANQSVTSDPATDVAGNTTTGKTVGGISIDGTAPATTSNNQCTKTNGWCTGSTANVVLTAADALSGVKEIHYRVDGGAEQVTAGASKTVSVPLDGSGAGTVAYWAVDHAGNAEPANAVALKWDNIAPAVTHTVSPAPNADDWNNSDTTVHFIARDDDSGSGLEAGSVTPDVVVSVDTPGQVVTGSARDTAGNVGTDSVTVKLDKTKPVITASIVGGSQPWHTQAVTVHFTCSDAGSGIPATACPDDVTLGDGANQSVSRTVADRAGNSATATLTGVNVDQEAPVIVSTSVADGAVYRDSAPAPTCAATDAVSGVESCTVVVTLVDAGTYAFTATAKDNAGNATTLSGRYRVHLYRFGGFLQPINDPSILAGSATSIFKTGSTVPVKFQLRNTAGAFVQAPAAPQWLAPVKGSLTTASVNEIATSDPAGTEGAFRWDATAQQYIYNWQTKGLTANHTYRLSVRLDDGQVLSVVVGLK
ncbi:hypothetical protein SAMN05192558_110123 [Actinokineospora alba]|uniref:Ig-like domain (Group 3) n=1 Tax=Actinokineospora alba TaxID=504798 RepID=A0A1H0TPX1_9PSEU|nr:PxKF domain-containing protein [Actinokineospora alba]TDP70652.1 hypothetical protein C8E96_6273 [Actinokineospora alba]SDJ12653.1 hypothetical protein SAMN05421871_110123 [Actinokineospora alba]SDP56102.1 hypothetical protein SAMN05192558_110123 [Actinokineospora alba]